MSIDERDDDRDLTAAFEQLRAPRSTAGYRERAPRPEVVRPAGSWMRGAGAALAVAVALGGAAAFLGLRNARQNGAATAVTAPPARSGAAMAFDSTTGMTIMYGGVDAAGRPLADTWEWDGSSWHRSNAVGAPAGLVGVRMSDDPTDGGVLLVGSPVPPVPPGSSGGITGCAVSGSGTASGTATTTAPSPAEPTAAGGAPGSAGGTPAASPPPITREPSSPPARLPPCQVVPAPTLETWILSAHGWSRAAPGAAADTPSPGAQVAFDAATGQVVAVTSWYAPLACSATEVMCPLAAAPGAPGASAGSSGGASAPSALPCRETAGGGCGYGGLTLQSWTWSHGRWTARPSAASALQPSSLGGAALLGGGSGPALLLTAASDTASACRPLASCVPVLDVWAWTGSAWTRSRTLPAPVFDPGIAPLALVGRLALAVGPDGATHTLDVVTGQVSRAGSVSPRVGEAMAVGPGGTVVLFGGSPVLSVATAGGGSPVPYAVAPPSGVGADTWRWDGHGWAHLFGAQPSAPPIPSPCAGDGTKGCPLPAPGQGGVVPQPAPAGTPGSAPGGTPTTVTAPPSPSPT